MKRNSLNEVKELDIKALFEKAKALKLEMNESVMDKNMDKHKDLKTISKKRKDLAQVLTILRQKTLVQDLEKKAEGVKVVASSEIKTAPAKKEIVEPKKKLVKSKTVKGVK